MKRQKYFIEKTFNRNRIRGVQNVFYNENIDCVNSPTYDVSWDIVGLRKIWIIGRKNTKNVWVRGNLHVCLSQGNCPQTYSNRKSCLSHGSCPQPYYYTKFCLNQECCHGTCYYTKLPKSGELLTGMLLYKKSTSWNLTSEILPAPFIAKTERPDQTLVPVPILVSGQTRLTNSWWCRWHEVVRICSLGNISAVVKSKNVVLTQTNSYKWCNKRVQKCFQ